MEPGRTFPGLKSKLSSAENGVVEGRVVGYAYTDNVCQVNIFIVVSRLDLAPGK